MAVATINAITTTQANTEILSANNLAFTLLADLLESLRAEIDAEMGYAVAKDEAAEAKSREELARELLEALRKDVEENRGKK